jgi:serine/threonine-protein kinase RsbW
VTNVGWLLTATIPARAGNVQLFRTIVAGVGARAGLTYDEIDDVRLAVQEAAGQILLVAPREGSVVLRVDDGDGRLRIEVSTASTVGDWPPPGIERSLAWTILTTLVDEVSLGRTDDGGSAVVRLTKPSRGAAGASLDGAE